MLRVRCRIHYRRRAMTMVLLALALLPVISLVRARTAPSSRQGAPMRQFYLTRSLVPGNQAPDACEGGYHFASIWEIADPSSLRYNTALGLTSTDSGQGPPTAIPFFGGALPVYGWVRTGHIAMTWDIPGQANCSGWLSGNGFDWGTVANLPSGWTAGEQDIGVWNAGVRTCDTPAWVWCVQDDSVWRNYLPIALK